jgi:hypothetical protein
MRCSGRCAPSRRLHELRVASQGIDQQAARRLRAAADRGRYATQRSKMYFWRIDKLKGQLQQGVLPQKEQFQYFLGMSVLAALATAPISTANNYDWISWGVMVPITVLGVTYWYRCNSADRGVRFFERAASISFVVTVRLLVLLALPALLIYFLVLEFFFEISLETTLADVMLFTILQGVLLWRIGDHIKQVARGGVA